MMIGRAIRSNRSAFSDDDDDAFFKFADNLVNTSDFHPLGAWINERREALGSFGGYCLIRGRGGFIGSPSQWGIMMDREDSWSALDDVVKSRIRALPSEASIDDVANVVVKTLGTGSFKNGLKLLAELRTESEEYPVLSEWGSGSYRTWMNEYLMRSQVYPWKNPWAYGLWNDAVIPFLMPADGAGYRSMMADLAGHSPQENYSRIESLKEEHGTIPGLLGLAKYLKQNGYEEESSAIAKEAFSFFIRMEIEFSEIEWFWPRWRLFALQLAPFHDLYPRYKAKAEAFLNDDETEEIDHAGGNVALALLTMNELSALSAESADYEKQWAHSVS